MTGDTGHICRNIVLTGVASSFEYILKGSESSYLCMRHDFCVQVEVYRHTDVCLAFFEFEFELKILSFLPKRSTLLEIHYSITLTVVIMKSDDKTSSCT